MRCKHGVLGGCGACAHEQWVAANAIKAGEIIAEIGLLVVDLGERNGLDTSTLQELLQRLSKAGIR